MEKHRAIPEGYMTVGEVAKKMGITVRTLQYYDKEGILSPSAESEGRRRLYTDKDMVKLYQVLSMKSLGFSLDDIKNHLLSFDTPEQVAQALTSQAEAIREKMATLLESLNAIETLKTEVLQMQAVNFRTYADIIGSLQMSNEFYWMIKHFDEDMLEKIPHQLDEESARAMVEAQSRIWDEAIHLLEHKVPPDSEAGVALAKEFWDGIEQFTGGDKKLLASLQEFGERIRRDEPKWEEKHAKAFQFIEPALGAYFSSINYNPYTEETK